MFHVLLAELNTTSLVFLLLILGVSAMLLWRGQRYLHRARRADARPTVSAASSAVRARATTPRDVESWQVEAHELVRQWTAQLDNKIRILDQLLRDADRQIARLERLHAQRGTASLAVPPAAEAEMPRFEAEVPPAALKAPAAAGQTNQAAALAEANRPAENAAALGQIGTPPKRSLVERQAEVYALADAGRTAADIARHVGTPVGEIELILALRGKAS
jgi:hypothetical protein